MTLSSWSWKRFIATYLSASCALAAVLGPLAWHYILSPEAMAPWSPNYEESYWTPAQVQIAAERLAAEIGEYRFGHSNLDNVKVRLAIVKSKLHEMNSSSDVGRLMASIHGYKAMVDELNTLVLSASAHLETPNAENLNAILDDIAAVRPLLIEFSSNARTLETEAKLGRDEEIQSNRRLLMTAFYAMLAAALVAVLMVLTRLRAREQELVINRELLAARQTALDEALRSEQARNTFLGKVSHEIHSPLQAILTNVQVMEERYLATSGLSKIVGRLKTSVTQLRAQVQDLLDASEIKNGMLSLKLEAVDLRQVFQDIIAVQQTSADNKNLALQFSCTKLGIVRTDGQRVGQILTNLTSNAIRNTDSGYVRVDAAMSEEGRRSILTLRVSDTGCGIPPEVEERLFQPFMRANNSRRGTGLGLAIVKGLVDQLDGEISYVTGKQGTMFTILLPMRQLEQVPIPSAIISQAPSTRPTPPVITAVHEAQLDSPRITRAKLLLLDDDVSIQETVGDFLSDQGFEVHVVGTVADAQLSIADERYDCLLLDMELPDGTGIDVAKAARTTKNHHTPTVAFSAYHDLLATPDAAIFSATLKKPVAIEELVASLTLHIGSGHAASNVF